MGMEELPGQIAQQVQDAVESEKQNSASDIERERIALERQRIRTEERMHERALESQEKIQGALSLDELRDMFQSFSDNLTSSLSALISRPSQTIEVDASHAQEEIPAAAEDAENSTADGTEELASHAVEGIEEIGGDTTADVESVADPVTEEKNNDGNSGRGRRRRGRR